MNFVQLVLRDAAPLGIELEKRQPPASPTPSARRRPPTVKTLTKLSRAVCTSKAMIDPDLFRGAAILGVNGTKWNDDGAERIFERHLSDANTERPVSVVLAPIETRGVEEAVNVNKRYDRFIELVFCEQSTLGIQLDTESDENVLKVRGLVEGTQSTKCARDCLLDPAVFEGATMLKIDGRGGDRDAIYQRLKTPDRPKAVLFELAPSAIDSEHLKNIRPPLPPTTTRRARDRRASLQMRDRAVFATKSVRKLSVEYQQNHNEDTLMRNVNESIRQLIIEEEDGENKATGSRRTGRALDSSLSASLKQLQISLEEMEELNAQNERENSKHSSSSIGSDETPRAGGGARARRVLQGLRKRRFRRRTESGRSIEEGSEQYSDSALDIDGEFETEEEKNKALDYLKQEAYQACLDAIREHLTVFLQETPDSSYEEWIEELHPENAKSTRNLIRGKSIDHRFYVEDSDHRQLWNSNLGDEGQRNYVHIRDYYSEESSSGRSYSSRSRPRPPPPKAFARSPPPRSTNASGSSNESSQFDKQNDVPQSGD